MFEIADLAEEVLDYLYTQLGQTPNGFPCQRKLGLCEMINPCCDYLGVYLQQLDGDSQFQSSCEYGSPSSNVVLSIKLLRPCSEKQDCKADNTTVVRSLYADAVVLRSGLTRFVSGRGDCYRDSFLVGPIVPICGETELCSGWETSLTVSMYVCDDGEFTGPIVLPARCGDCDTTDTGNLNVSVESNDRLESYR